MRTVRAAVSACLLALLACLLDAPPASASAVWTPPETLGLSVSDISLDVDPAGDAVAVWTTDAGVKASYRPAGQDWQHPVLVTPASAHAPLAVIDAKGRATAVWHEGDDVRAADRDSRGRWRVDDEAPGPGGACCWSTGPDVAADADGNLVVVWTVSNDFLGDSTSILWRSRGGPWTPGGRSGLSSWPYLGALVAARGVATFAKGGSGVFATTSRRTGGEATAWRRIAPGVEVGNLVLAANRRGDLILAALDGGDPDGHLVDGDPGRLVVLTRPAGQPWRPAFQTATQQAVRPAVAISDDGRVGVVYQRASDSALEVRLGDVLGDRPGAPKTLSPSAAYTGPAALALSPGGAAVATWSTGSAETPGTVLTAARPAHGPWGQPQRIGHRDARPPAAYGYPNGMFTVLYSENGTAKWTDRVDDTVGPRTHMRRPARGFQRSTRVAVSWVASDELARPRDMDVRVRSAGRTGGFGAWSLWKHHTLDTSGVLVGKPGRTYCFSARARDRVGNLGAWSTQRCSTTPVDDRSFAGRGWSRTAAGSAYLGTLSRTAASGRQLRLASVSGRTLRLLARTCPTCGTVRVSHGGRVLGTFRLTSPRTRDLQPIMLGRYSRVRGGAVVIRVVSSGRRVQIDGLVASR